MQLNQSAEKGREMELGCEREKERCGRIMGKRAGERKSAKERQRTCERS